MCEPRCSNWIRLQDKRLKDAVLQQFEVEPMGPVCSVIVTTVRP